MRLDKYLIEVCGVDSRSHAKLLIERGEIYVNDKETGKVSYNVKEGDKVEIRQEKPLYVGRGAVKLAKFFNGTPPYLKNLDVALDVGSSTGGFTQVLLEKGVKKVFAIDVGSEQLHDSLKKRKEVVLMENTDIRDVKKEEIGEVHFAVSDVSFNTIREMLPAICELLTPPFTIVFLFKPQFEMKQRQKEEGFEGVVQKEQVRQEILEEMKLWLEHSALPVTLESIKESRVQGKRGNKEYFLVLKSA